MRKTDIMGEEREAATRLKARLDRWHVYNQRSQAEDDTVLPPVAAPDIRQGGSQKFDAVSGARMLSPPTGQTPVVVLTPTHPLVEQHEMHIADLQEAVEHERERSQQLAQTLHREQALHFITLTAEAQERPAPVRPSLPDYPSDLFLQGSNNRQGGGRSVLPLIIVLLLTVGIWALFRFLI